MIQIVPYHDHWPEEFKQVGFRIRSAAGEHALAIHHIGSTSVQGLAAKDVIDIQMTVAELDAGIDEMLNRAALSEGRILCATIGHPEGMKFRSRS